MNNPHEKPNYIFTSFLSISHLFISHTSSQVTILACYGNLLNGEIESISIETDFSTLNELLAEAGEEAEEAIEKIVNLLTHPSKENAVVDLSESGGITFQEHVFSFLIIYDESDDGKMIETEEHSYYLNAYIKRQNLLPDFIENPVPENGAERSVYFNSILTMQYQFYLVYRKNEGENKALAYANLRDPFYFNLAQTQYQMSGQKNN